MITTTAAYRTAVKAVSRKWHGRVEITWTDPTIDTTIQCSTNDLNYMHTHTGYASVDPPPVTLYRTLQHAADLKNDIPYIYGLLGRNHADPLFLLDGTRHLFPGTTATAALYTTGWYGATPCGDNKKWDYGTSTTTTSTTPMPWPPLAVNPILTQTFAARPMYNLIVCGDNKRLEYPESFIVRVYALRADVVPIYTTTVTDGAGTGWTRSLVNATDATAVLWEHDIFNDINSCERVELEIVKWSKANSVVKIAEFYTSITEIYEDDEIVSMNLKEESLVADGTLPVGNISANELDLKLQNVTDQYFVGNTDSPIHTVIKRNRKIKAWIGLELPSGTTEWIPLGIFWSGDWKADELGTVASTTARDRMELLRKDEFEVSDVYENETLYDLAEHVLSDAKTKQADLQYVIDAALADITLPYAWFVKTSYFECIREIAEACQGYAYVDRYGVLRIVSTI